MKHLYIIIAIAMLLSLSFVSAAFPRGEIQPDLKLGLPISEDANIYPAIKIIDWIGLGADIADLVLMDNSKNCGEKCVAQGHTTLYKDSALIEDIKFDKLLADGSWVNTKIRSYQLYFSTEQKENEVNDYGWVCSDSGEYTQNGTAIQSCAEEIVGSHIEYSYDWKQYNLGDILPAGDYFWKLEGQKSPSEKIDWIITIQNQEIRNWAVWGGSYAYSEYLFENASNLGQNTGSSNAMGDLTGSGGSQVNGKWGKAMNLTNGYNTYSYSTMQTTGAWAFWWMPRYDTATEGGAHCLIVSDKSGANKGDFSIGYSGCNGYGTGGGIAQQFNKNGGGVAEVDSTTTNFLAGHWYFIVMKINATAQYLFVDGVQQGMNTDGIGNIAFYTTGQTPYFMGASDLNATIDDAAFFTTDLTNAQILTLNSTGTLSSLVTLNSPADNSITNNTNVNFNCSFSIVGGATGTNMSLWINGNLNQTNSLTGTINETIFSKTLSDGQYNWTCQGGDSDGANGFASSNRSLTVDTIAPLITILYPTGTINGLTNGENVSLNYSIFHPAGSLSSCSYNYSNNIYLINCSLNSTFVYQTGVNSIIINSNDTAGNNGSSTSTWTIGTSVINVIFNATSYETATETLSINATNMTNAYLIYNGTSYLATINQDTASRQLTIPNIGNKSFYWKLNGGSFNSSVYYQNILPINFTYCNYNSPINQTYVNYTFKDEANNNDINVSIPYSTFKYWLGDGSINKTLTYINNNEQSNFSFCFTPSYRNINIIQSIQYQSTGYPQRTYAPSTVIYSNITNETLLYLLSTSVGQDVTISVINIAQQTISGVDVLVSTIVNGVNTVVGHGTTDNAGSVTFFLNPNYQHTFVYTKSRYDSLTQNIVPTNTVYTVRLLYSSQTITDYRQGIMQSFLPTEQFLTNGTNYNFEYTISSSIYSLDKFGFILINDSNDILDSQSSLSSSGGTVISNTNTGNNSKIIMNYYYVINGTYTNGTGYWMIQNEGNHYSIWFFFQDLTLYMNGGLLGIDMFGRALISFLIIVLMTGGLAYRYGIQNEAAISGMCFSIVLALDYLGFLPNPSNLSINPIPVITAIVFISFLLKEELG